MDDTRVYRNKLDKSQDSLEAIKEKVRTSHDYFLHNYDRYNEFRRLVFESSLTQDDITLLQIQNKPQLEFNTGEAYISRLLGEFSQQEPDIEVSSDDESTADPLTIKVVEAHLRHTLQDRKNAHTRYEVMKDLLSGGFSGLKVITKYPNPMSMDQIIEIVRVYDPTLCGYDVLARESHKGDGNHCHELYPMSSDIFEEENPEIDIRDVSFRRNFEGFNWSYANNNTKILLVCDFYKKVYVNTEIVNVQGKGVMKLRDYKKLLATWGELAAPPAIIGKPRKTKIVRIDRARLIENQIIEYVETDFTMLPLIFVDGNSVLVKGQKNSNVHQVTRPYLYHTRGAQRLKNYAGISLANEIENTVQHKFMVAKEALPKEEEFLEAYKDVQKARTLVFNSVYEENPELPINNAIREIQRIGAPPEILQAFTGADSLMQNILGSYDASLGINNNQLSGIAIVEAASQSNPTAKPYIVGYLQGYQRAAEVYVDLMPKYLKTPRTIPILDTDGQRQYVKINQKDGVNMFFDANVLNVVVKAGASFQVQKSRTLMMIKEMMGMSPLFQQFMAEKGLPFILDNMEGKGIDELKSMVNGWLQEMQQQKQQAMQQQQQQMQNNPIAMRNQIETQKLQQESVKNQQQFAVDMKELQLKEKQINADIMETRMDNHVDLVKASTERFSKEMDLKIKDKDVTHRHLKEAIETHHKIHQPERQMGA